MVAIETGIAANLKAPYSKARKLGIRRLNGRRGPSRIQPGFFCPLNLQPTDAAGTPQGRPLVAVDLVSAAPGQPVFYVRGREAANALPDPDNPADAAIVGIVDAVREQPIDGAA